jgi:hypothetical protein
MILRKGNYFPYFLDHLAINGYNIGEVLMPEKGSERTYFWLMAVLLMMPALSWFFSGLCVRPGLISRMTIGLVMNALSVSIMLLVCIMLIFFKSLGIPSGRSIGQLTFGLFVNVIIFLFVFQNELQIAQYIDIYISTICILILYFLIIDRKSINIELSFMSICLFAFSRYHMEFIYRSQREIASVETLVYFAVPVLIIVIYAIKIHKLRTWDWFTVPYFILSIILFGMIAGAFGSVADSNQLLTAFLVVFPFYMITDLLIFTTNKKLKLNRIAFYIRTDTLVLLSVLLVKGHYFDFRSLNYQNLSMFACIMAISIVTNILENRLVLRAAESQSIT